MSVLRMVQNPLDRVAQGLKREKHKALVAYLTAGYPSFREQEDLIQTMEDAGVNILELGVPFSDPIADGPTIQYASQESLKKGTTLEALMEWVLRLKAKVQMPLVLMSYLNPIFKYGVNKFALDAQKVGVSGLIVPDMIIEEGDELSACLNRHSLDLIYLVAPTSPPHRQKAIASKTRGFLYAVSVTGVTGARSAFPQKTKDWLSQLRGKSPVPVYVGFGISKAEYVRRLKSSADGFVVGSALIDVIREYQGRRRMERVRRLVNSLAKECRNGH